MAVLCKLYQDNRETSAYKGKWYARAIHVNEIDLEGMAAKIQENVTAKAADVYAVLREMVNVMSDSLKNSIAVNLNGIGRFKVGISTTPADTAADFSFNKNVKGYRVNFLPEHKYLNGSGKGTKSTIMMLQGVSAKETPKNDVDTDNG